jgi:hypothetical protein
MRLRLHFPSLIDIPDSWSALQSERLQQIAVQAFERAVTTLDIPGVQIEFVHMLQEKRVHPTTRPVPQDFARRSVAQALDTAASVQMPGATKSDTQLEKTWQRDTWPGIRALDNDALRGAMNIPPERTQQHNTRPGIHAPDHDDVRGAMNIPPERTQQRNMRPGIHAPDHDALRGATNIPPERVQQHNRGVQFDTSHFGNPESSEFLPRGDHTERADWSINSTPDDDIIGDSFPSVAVLQGEGSDYIYAGGSPHVKAQNLARALHWGAYLFGNDGFAVLQPKDFSSEDIAVLQPKDFSSEGPFYVVRLLGGIRLEEGSAFTLPSGEQAIGLSASMLQSADYSIVTVVDDKGRSFFGNRAHDSWNYTRVKQTLEHIPLPERTIDPAFISEVAPAKTNQAVPPPGDHGMIDIIAWMGRALFAAMPWAKRAAYLNLLIAAWKTEREKATLLEIICSTHTGAELEAIFALLRKQGKYEKLFERFNAQLYELLLMLGEFVADQKLDWRYLATLLSDVEQPSQATRLTQQRTLQGLLNAAEELRNWLQSRWESISVLFNDPEEVAETLEYLVELLWVVQQAQSGDLQAQLFVTEIVVQTGTTIEKAMRGLSYARELGTSYTRRESEADINHAIFGELQAALILKVLKWFLSNDESRTAINATGSLTERLASLMNTLRVWEPTERAATMESNSDRGDMTEQMTRGLNALLECPQWDRTTIMGLLDSITATNRNSFLHTMLFVDPSELETWDFQTVKGLAEHPHALALIREAGYQLFAVAFNHAGGSWERFDLFFVKLAARRKYIGDPIDYQWLLDRLSRGEAYAFDEVDYPNDRL